MNAKGIKEVLYEAVNVATKDYSHCVEDQGGRADLVYWGGLHDTGGLILRQPARPMCQATFMGAMASRRRIRRDRGPGAEGTLMTFSPDRAPPANKQIIESSARRLQPRPNALHYARSRSSIRRERRNRSTPKRVAEVMHSGKVFRPCSATSPSTRRVT